MGKTQVKVEDVCGDIISNYSFSSEQIIKPNVFSTNNVKKFFCINKNLFKAREDKVAICEPSVPPEFILC